MKTSVNILILLACGLLSAVTPDIYAQDFKTEVVDSALDTFEAQKLLPQTVEEENLTGPEEDTREPVLEEPDLMIDVLQVQNMDLPEIFKLISSKSDLYIIHDEDVHGEISIYLKDVNALDALRIILETKNLAYEVVDNPDELLYLLESRIITPVTKVVKIMSGEDFLFKYGYAFREKERSQEFSLKYADAEDMKDAVQGMLSAEGRIVVNEADNSLIVIDTPKILSLLQEFLPQVDIETQQKTFFLRHEQAEHAVGEIRMILTPNVGKIDIDKDANSLTVTDTAVKLKIIEQQIMEMDFKGRKILLEVKVLQVLLNDEHQQGVDWEAIASNYQVLRSDEYAVMDAGTLLNEDYKILLDALDTVGVLTTVSNKNIPLNKDVPTVIPVEDTGDQGQSRLRTFYLKPKIKALGEISLMLSADDYSFSRKDESDKKSAEFIYEDGITIIVGGMFGEITVESLEKVPFLGSIPILGIPFRSQRQRLQKTEYILFITPRVVSEPPRQS